LALGRLKATELICQQARLLWIVLAGDVHCHFRLRATLTIETAIISAFTSFIPTIGADILALKAGVAMFYIFLFVDLCGVDAVDVLFYRDRTAKRDRRKSVRPSLT
jgi:hypothetical protein